VAQIPPEQFMRLFRALQHCEEQLRSWSGASEANSRLFHDDPAAALEAANLQLDRDAMVELESVLRELAQKLQIAPAGGGDVI
jgi:hypothetical protein